MGLLAINPRAFDDPRFRRIEQHVRAHLSDPKRLSLVDAARMANLCPEHFCRLFRARVGVSFTDWQCGFRVDQAVKLLVSTRLQVGSVGAAVGYANPPAFTRVFRRCQGVAPRQLRMLVRAQPELRPILASGLPNAFAVIRALSSLGAPNVDLLGLLADDLASAQ